MIVLTDSLRSRPLPISQAVLDISREFVRQMEAAHVRRLVEQRVRDLVDPSGRPLIERCGVGSTVRVRIPERFR